MKKNKILILALLSQLLLTGAAQAKCDLESFKFGTSHKALMSKLKVSDDLIEPELKDISERVVFLPGELVCKNEKTFEGVPVNFIFLYDKLVEIQLMSFSQELQLFNWAESIYGEKENKPNSFYYDQPNAQWLWDNSNATIAYSVKSDEYEMIESIIIQSLNHQKHFERLAKEQEGE